MSGGIVGIDGRKLAGGLPPLNTAFAEGPLVDPLSIAVPTPSGEGLQFIAVGGMHKLDQIAVEIMLVKHRLTLGIISDQDIAECFSLASRVLAMGQRHREGIAQQQGKAADNANGKEGRH